MKKIHYLLTAISLLISFTGSACNTCGCGVGSYHYGILPQYQSNFIGIRYRYRSFDSKLDGSHYAPYSYERFQSTELWARFYPVKKLQVFAFIPYNFNQRNEGDQVTSLRGIGDMVVAANYNVLNTYDSASTTLKHSLLLGGGLKLPTGRFNAIQNGLTINQNFQLGTGSLDFLANLIYTVRYKKAGLNAEFTYSYNTTNRDEYRFGNTTRSALSTFYVMRLGAVTVTPNVGVSLETFKDNSQFRQSFQESGGWAALYNAGIESYFRRFALGITYSHAGKQQLFNEKVTANDRMSMHLTFMF